MAGKPKAQRGYLELPFLEFEEMRKKKDEEWQAKVSALQFFPSPHNDNERLMNLQRQWLMAKDDKALVKIGSLCTRIAKRMIDKEIKKRGIADCISFEMIEEKAHSVGFYFVEMYLKDKYWLMKSSWGGYIYRRVLFELFDPKHGEVKKADIPLENYGHEEGGVKNFDPTLL